MDWLALSPDEWVAVRLSIWVATWATVISLPFGILIALALARGNFPGKSLLNGLVHLPLILPPVVTGYLLLLTFGRRAPLGQFFEQYLGIVFSFRWTGAALACGVMGFPLLVRAIRLSIEAVDSRLEEAAGTLGANRAWVFATITLPLMAPVLGLLAVRDVAVSLQATFTATYLLTDGGPDRATLLLPIYSFDMGFELLRYGYASAMMLLGFLACLALGFAQYLVVRRWKLHL